MSAKFDLREQPYVLLTVRAYRAAESTTDGNRGVSTLRFSVASVEDEAGQEIGSVSAGIGHIVIDDLRRSPSWEREYLVPLEDIWQAFQEAIEDQGIYDPATEHDCL